MPTWQEIEKRLERYKMTDFQRRVLKVTFEIPKGKMLTYKQVAEKAGRRNAARAVGTIMKNNPLAPTIPCHRVIRSDGKIGNYSGPGGKLGKMGLLIKEKAIYIRKGNYQTA